jgi:hypothetical protein
LDVPQKDLPEDLKAADLKMVQDAGFALRDEDLGCDFRVRDFAAFFFVALLAAAGLAFFRVLAGFAGLAAVFSSPVICFAALATVPAARPT